MLRQVVPALGAVALFTTSALAADKDVVTISGWSDNILYVADDQFTQDIPTTAKDEAQPSVFFTANASVKVGWTVTDRLHAKVNLWLYNTPTGGASTVQMRESFIVVDLGDGLSWTMGKYISHLGWISAEPTGLYRINASNIGYTAYFYGNDVTGTAIAFAKKDSPFSGSFHVVNGYFTAPDASNTGFAGGSNVRGATRENYDMGYGLDLNWGFGKDAADNVNLEFADDPHGGTVGVSPGDRGGNVFQVGLNATVKDVTDLTLGGEVIYRNTTTAKTSNGTGGVVRLNGTHFQDLGYMLLGNYSIAKWTPIPASVTLSFQQYQTNYRAAAHGETTFTDIAVAVLTNPLKSQNFGLNGEISYVSAQDAGGTPGTDEAWIFSLEAIAVIP